MAAPEELVFGRRRDPNDEGPSRAIVRIGIRRMLRQGDLTAEQQVTLLDALDDDDAIDLIREKAARARLPDGTRDWPGFFAAFAEFIKAILPLIMEIIKSLGGGLVG
jgi:hypothetical protein